MSINELIKLESNIQLSENDYVEVNNWLNAVIDGNIYSYKIFAIMEDNIVTKWRTEICISQTDEYNTISKTDVMSGILDSILKYKTEKIKQKCIGFKQPPLELMLKLYEPLIHSLATTQHRRWKIEFDDLCQMCRLSIISLYKKGYFLHKNLISTTFIRDVLQTMRVYAKEPEQIKFSKLDKENREYVNYLEDESAQNDFEEIINPCYESIEDKRRIVKEEVGERIYEQIIREYNTKTVSPMTRKRVNKLKHKFGGLE